MFHVRRIMIMAFAKLCLVSLAFFILLEFFQAIAVTAAIAPTLPTWPLMTWREDLRPPWF